MLQGIRAIEMGGMGPVSCAGMMLADLGAEVILVERDQAPPAAELIATRRLNFFHRGKRSITVDLKTPGGVDIALQLIESADILIEGFRPGVMERLGVSPHRCLERKSSLVYGRISGWGQAGPLANALGHDPNYLALSGTIGPGPIEFSTTTAQRTIAGDLGGSASVLLLGVLSALIRSRSTGIGQVVDSSITESCSYLHSLLWMLHAQADADGRTTTNEMPPTAPWRDLYACQDGRYVSVAALEPASYRALVDALNLGGDSAFAVPSDQCSWPAARRILQQRFAQKPQAYWTETFARSDACVRPVLGLCEVEEHPQHATRNSFVRIDGVLQPAPAPRFDDARSRVAPVPAVGQHSAEILADLALRGTTCALPTASDTLV